MYRIIIKTKLKKIAHPVGSCCTSIKLVYHVLLITKMFLRFCDEHQGSITRVPTNPYCSLHAFLMLTAKETEISW